MPDDARAIETAAKSLRRAGHSGGVFVHSNLDAIFLALTAAQLGLIAWGALNYATLSLVGMGCFAIAHVTLAVTHYNAATHNFIHNAFFRSRALNFLYGLASSIVVMSPCTLLRIDHMEHHTHVNDLKDPQTGTTKDATSTYRFGKNGGHEPLWRYALLSPLRDWAASGETIRFAARSAERRVIGVETAVIAAFWLALIATDWRFALFYLLVVYLGVAGTYAENFFEHYGAIPGDRKKDSVSCYDPIYNFLWFNNGYHQEHHYRPGVHWTKVSELRKDMPPENQRRVIKWAHLANLPWLAR